MKIQSISRSYVLAILVIIFIIFACSTDDGGGSGDTTPTYSANQSSLAFGETIAGNVSASSPLNLSGSNITGTVQVGATTNFEVSKDNTSFSSNITLSNSEANQTTTIYVRFAPTETVLGELTGTLTVSSSEFDNIQVNLTGNALDIPREIQILGTVDDFGDVTIETMSTEQSVQVKGLNLENDVTATVAGAFEISKDNVTFSTTLTFDHTAINATAEDIYIRFIPAAADLGIQNGTVTFSATGVDDVVTDISGTGIPVIHNYQTFSNQRIAFGGGHNQTETATFMLHNDLTNIESIKMYVQLDCPTEGCNAWDVYANIKVKDDASGEFYEIGRYITPYGVDTSQLERGFEIDVTDFKSLLQGSTELYARIETWGSDGWELSVDFDYVEGTPDYPYYAVADIITYDDWSTSGVPYGVTIDPATWDLTKSVSIPANAEATHLRTIISGWGHATPTDSDGRPCAEWCYRTHDIFINGANIFQHEMGPIGCGTNPVSPQSGNWAPDRAGWCPGMAVPVRINAFDIPLSGTTFTYEYDYEDWTSDGGSTSGSSGAFYATSSFVVVKSNTPITKPTVAD